MRSTRRAREQHLLELSVATAAEVDAIKEALIAAEHQEFRCAISSLVMHVIAQVL
jgi:hypothetical protein